MERALAHRSWCAENPGESSNERLEFLGDAVLGMVVTDQLIRRHPDRSEGWLSRARSSLVRAGTLYQIAVDWDLGGYLRLGKGEELTGGRAKPSILADAVEAIIGAVYLDGGMDAASDVIGAALGRHLDGLDANISEHPDAAVGDFKSRLQEYCARGGGDIPTYTWSESGPEHAKNFAVEVHLHGRTLATGSGRSKKQAEQAAAARALDRLDSPTEDDPTAPEPSRSAQSRANEVKSG